MSFIAKNPLIMPEITTSPTKPNSGLRGIFPMNDGWYEIDSNGNVKKIANGESSGDTSALEKEIENLKEAIKLLQINPVAKKVEINLLASAWIQDSDTQFHQEVDIEGVTSSSKVDLQPTVEQLSIFHEKDITFITENDDGNVTVYCIGQKPTLNYTIQATILEVI